MRKAILVFLFLAKPVFCSDLGEASRDYRFQPCDGWGLTSGMGWHCNYLGPYIQVPTMNEINRLESVIQRQEDLIRQLEQRISRLEK